MKNSKLKRGLRLALCVFLLTGFTSKGQIQIDTSFTAEKLVKQILIGNGILVGPVSYQGPKHAMGYFHDPSFNVHLEEGIVLTSGNAFFVQGPNRVPDKGWASGTAGDVDLDAITAGETHDAAILEFDFVTSSEYLSFNYVFGSEEYLEYVGSKYNDVFGFFIDGPGLDHLNLATLPESDIPITVNNINHKRNRKYYHDNGFQNTSHPFIWDNRKKKPVRNKRYGKALKEPPYSVQYDGFTRVLEARCRVIPNEIYHIKLAIADVSDYILDSGVFLEGGSFRSFGDEMVVMKNPFEPLQNDILKQAPQELQLPQNVPPVKRLANIPQQLHPNGDMPATLEFPEIHEPIIFSAPEIYNVQFDFDSYDIPTTFSPQLSRLFGLVEDHPHAAIKIIGHTDNVGSEAYNFKLSALRSKAVANYLQNLGMESSRIQTAYLGETKPIYANSTELGRTRNRRVEFVVEYQPELNTSNYIRSQIVENDP